MMASTPQCPPRSVAASLPVTAASLSRGTLTYRRYAALSHLPSVLISESSTPAIAAVVAAPILKLWPAYFPASIPALPSAALKHRTSFSLDKGAHEAKVKNGPFSLPCTAMYAATALTGHRSLPRYTKTPRLKGSVFDAFMQTCTSAGGDPVPRHTSPSLKWASGSGRLA